MNINEIERIKEKIKSYKIIEKTDYISNRVLSFLTTADLKNTLSKENTFVNMLNRKLREKNMEAPDCYRKANIDKSAFSKIISGKTRPKRKTIALLALALRLSSEEYDEFLASARYARSNELNDPISVVGVYIDDGEYDIKKIEETVKELTGDYLAYYGE